MKEDHIQQQFICYCLTAKAKDNELLAMKASSLAKTLVKDENEEDEEDEDDDDDVDSDQY